MADDSAPDDLTPEQQEAVEQAELLSGYGHLANAHVEELADETVKLPPGPEREEAISETVKWYHWTFLVLIAVILIILAAFAFTRGDSADSAGEGQSSAEGGTQTAAEGGAQTPAGLEEQDPIALTDTPWVFFADESEAMGLYVIEFAADGSCSAVNDPHVYGGWYEVRGDNVDIALLHRETLEAGSFKTVHESEELFHMARTGNTLRGAWEVEDMYYSEDGLVVEGTRINQPAVYGRPQ